ncbi:MAG: 1-deoxy-D-xylulose-5-phosphate synthase [Candidatus Sumerlaeaceae bacterium]|nr:1-deoxy-D-xylulose-5-phosphate synthase [Candidatus Sumerlaeaceae bacterium]
MKTIDLAQLESPAQIREADISDLRNLAEQIRRQIVETVAVNGGHLASSLGAVELAIALHYVFNTPTDKLIWDVGHQGYAHKLLTGRAKSFSTLRKQGGLSGFLRRSESEYDVFGAGHAGTSISAALGLAIARDLKGANYKVVAVIGDGSMTCGLPFEGLNNAGHLGTDLLVVLNDNEMSISENVGALAKYLNMLVQSRFYNKSKEEAYALVKRAPARDKIIRLVHRLEESTKGLILPSIFFEDLGFRYIGPVDGHDLEELIKTFRRVREWRGPILVHAITKKGKGYREAEGDAIFWHSPPTFKVETGETKKSSALTYTHVYGRTLVELAETDERVVAITAAMATGTGLVEFAEKFPNRFFDVGIAEAHAVTSAAGMALEGLRPFVTIYSTFLQRAFDSIVHDVALQKLPVVFAMDRAGFVGFDGPTHHGLLDIAYLRIIPNMVVMAPKDEAELRDMMFTAKNYMDGPIAFRYPRASVSGADISRPPRELPIGKAELIKEGRSPVCLISFGHIYENVVAASEILAAEGIDASIINARFVKPLDMEMLAWAAAHHDFLFSIEEGCLAGGFGSAVNEAFIASGIQRRCHIFAVPDLFIEHGEQSWQQDIAGLSPQKIAERVRAVVARGVHASVTAPTHPHLTQLSV